MNKILKALLSNPKADEKTVKLALNDEMASALKNKRNGKPQPDLQRHLSGPLQKSTTIDGRTFQPKPHKFGRNLDPVQDEANKKLYINGYGQRDRADLDFIDNEGTYYLNKNSNHHGDLQYSNLKTKGANNGKHNKLRDEQIKRQSHPSVDTKKFHTETLPGKDGHHMAGLDQFDPVFKGLSEKNRIKMIELFQKNGIFTGNHQGNLASLSTSVHQRFHSWLQQNGLMGPKSDLSKLSFNKRLPYVESLIKEFKQAERQLFDMQMLEKHGETFITSRELHAANVKSMTPELAGFQGY